MADANTVRQEVEKRAYKAYFDDQAQTSGEIVKSMADFALAERQKVSDQFIEMLSTFGLHRPADKETGPWHRGECHPNCKACDMINAIRSQAATERGEPHAKS